MMRILALASVVAMTLLLGSAASAATLFVTFTGVVADGFDETGVFGGANTSLAGEAFKVVYALDESEGFSAFNPPVSSEFDSGPFARLQSTYVTIAGQTFRIPSDSPDVSFARTGRTAGGPWSVEAEAYYFAVDTASLLIYRREVDTLISSLVNPFTDYDYRSRLDYTLQLGDVSSGRLLIDISRIDVCPPPGCGGAVQHAWATLTPLSVSVAVPEPSTWAMMIAGMGLAGAALRRARALSARPA